MITLQRRKELSKTAACLLRSGGSLHEWKRIKRDIETGLCSLYYVTNGSYLVLSINGGQLFIHAGAGRDATMLMQLCVQVARTNNCTVIVFRTEKRGLPRLLGRTFRLHRLGEHYYMVNV